MSSRKSFQVARVAVLTLWALLLVLILGSAPARGQQDEPAPTSTANTPEPPADPTGTAGQAPLSEAARRLIRDEVSAAVDVEVETLRAEAEKLRAEMVLVEQAETRQARTFDVISTFGSILAVAFAVFSILLVAITAWGLFSLKKITEAKGDADSAKTDAAQAQTNAAAAKSDAGKAKDDASQAQTDASVAAKDAQDSLKKAREAYALAKPIKEMLEGAQAAWEEIEAEASPLLERLEQYLVAGEKLPVPVEEAQAWKDFDVFLTVSDRLRVPPDNSRRAKQLVDLARYWRAVKEFARAEARGQRAIDLDPQNAEAHLGLAKTLSAWSADSTHASERKEKMLDRALEEITNAEKLGLVRAAEGPHRRGWIMDEYERFDDAIRQYRKAIQLDDQHVTSTSDKPFYIIRYDLACVLTRVGGKKNLAEARELLCQVRPYGDFWEMAGRDDDLKKLRRWLKGKEPCPPTS